MSSIVLLLLAACGLLLWWLWPDEQELELETPDLDDDRIPLLLRGIRFLLEDQPDQALKELVQVARLRTETVEVYLSLAALFRKKGEYARAVRIHQNLLLRSDLQPEMRFRASLGLAKDFHDGGLIDRAVQHYEKVLTLDSANIEALTALLRLHEQEHCWDLAIEVLQHRDRVCGENSSLHLAYLWFQQADEAFARKEGEQAAVFVARALSSDSRCAAALLLKFRLCVDSGDLQAALEVLDLFMLSVPEYRVLLPAVLWSYPFDVLHDWLHQRSVVENDSLLFLACLLYLYQHQGVQASQALLEQAEPQIESLRACLLLAACRDQQEAINVQARRWLQQTKHFYCTHCGAKVMELRWQCPQCQQWGSMHAIKGDEL